MNLGIIANICKENKDPSSVKGSDYKIGEQKELWLHNQCSLQFRTNYYKDVTKLA